METLFLSARQAFEGGLVHTPYGDVRILPKARDGGTVTAPDGTRLILRVEQARRFEVEMTGLQADYGGHVRVEGILFKLPSGCRHNEETFHETEIGPVILTILIPESEAAVAERRIAGDPGGVAGAGLKRPRPGPVAVRTEWRTWTAVLVVAAGGLIVGVPIILSSMQAAKRTTHLGQLRAAAQALTMYAEANDNRLPPAPDALRVAGFTQTTEIPLEVPPETLGAILGAETPPDLVLVRDAKPWPHGPRGEITFDGRTHWRTPPKRAPQAR